MKRKADSYSDAPEGIAQEIARSVPVRDFLPPPKEIAAMLKREKTVPVTMKLKERTLLRYKSYARRRGIRYQTFVSTILDRYAEQLAKGN
jgi:predicted DNA binding CopG/RHH family protein